MNPTDNQHHTPTGDGFGSVPNHSETFGKLPQSAEGFGNVRQTAEAFRTAPQAEENRDKYTLTVREVSRMFETAGVARSERSIVNWCQRNALGAAKLDAYYDPNERRYYITPESVDLAIAEEKAKAIKHGAEGLNQIPKPAEATQTTETPAPARETDRMKALEAEVLDLKITNRAKDYFITELKSERDHFAEERKELIGQLVGTNRRVGELETRLMQLEAPADERVRRLEIQTDGSNNSKV